MNSQGRSIFYIFTFVGILIGLSVITLTLYIPSALAQDVASTPTKDAFAQPELPPDPTELEMGKYLYWQHCMPCHGDDGQGLTDDFRSLWEEHQNCWERGCHGGKSDDEGFPIPTTIPAIVTGDHLSQFRSEDELFDFLKATHPPQYPGFLKDEEYHDIAIVLFKMNSRLLGDTGSGPASSPASTPNDAPFTSELVNNPKTVNTNTQRHLIVIGLSIAILVGVVSGIRNHIRTKKSNGN